MLNKVSVVTIENTNVTRIFFLENSIAKAKLICYYLGKLRKVKKCF